MTPVHLKLYQTLLTKVAKYIVDLEAKTCQCCTWFDTRKPCIHATRCYNAIHQDPMLFFDDVYSTKRFKLLYAAHVVPVQPQDLDSDPLSRAPDVCRLDLNPSKPGPKTRRRKRSNGMRN
ncbi:hypothetical protein, variant 2 [Aphanomyces astaci]|uniref:SWIM-type domain-containing protein n=1 Tax=Aphanomyces astaci TaxID=112090 RepID=W4FCD1_APHAT|nr:hypothetical protein, variant 1 [Aphanomyces astaci]XP_009846132.1 hypothetical protein, variant 2 [Aphanomyces astaci]ETV64388.1 hypothetical protein, variant 1 [Aphanomyces astaci]ETV64389.1 hypothetical protein, variant 2 [Aphanomyces astaci]|eukprot:XP_009846131.1 hypothetical protein, variant 1 [Aphanomyces astaci]